MTHVRKNENITGGFDDIGSLVKGVQVLTFSATAYIAIYRW